MPNIHLGLFSKALIQRTLCALSHLIVVTTLKADYDYPHFTANEIEI